MKSYVSSHFRSKEGNKMEGGGEHDDHAAPEVAGPSKGVAVEGFKVASIYMTSEQKGRRVKKKSTFAANSINCVDKEGGGVKKSHNFVDVIYGGP